MSPRAACRLEALGFGPIYDYNAGIADWRAAGLAVEGSENRALEVMDATRPDIPVVEPGHAVGAARQAVFAAGWEEALVVDCDGLVVGRLRGDAWKEHPDSPVDEVMEVGPTTVRPDGLLHALYERMEKRNTSSAVVTDPQGRLLGVVLLDDARRLISGNAPETVWKDCDGCPGRWARP